MKIHKIVVAISVVVLCSGSTMIAQAWWGDLLYPGAMVFDTKRFADSIRETEQAIATVQNTLENINNKIRMLTAVNLQLDTVFQAVQQIGNIPAGKNAADLAAIQKQARAQAENDEAYEEILYSSIESVNQDIAKAAQIVFQNQQLRQAAQDEILAAETDGLLGEQQKKNATAALEVLEGADQAQGVGAQFMKQVTMQEAQFTVNRIEREKARAGEFYGYDPYHPNEYDVQKRVVKTKSLGFMKFGE